MATDDIEQVDLYTLAERCANMVIFAHQPGASWSHSCHPNVTKQECESHRTARRLLQLIHDARQRGPSIDLDAELRKFLS